MKMIYSRILQLSGLILFFNSFAVGQNTVVKLDSLFSSLHTKREFNGNILISENGKITYNKSYGFADELAKEKLTNNHLFFIASITKGFTATSIVMLKEKNKLNYEDKITKFIPELTEYKNITLRNLLNHTSGIGDLDILMDSLFAKDFNGAKNLSNIDVINILTKYKPTLKSEPSEKYEYSNIGYQLLGRVIEKTSGLSFAEFIRKSIFTPLKMKNSFVYGENFTLKPIAKGHYYDDSLRTVQIANTISDYKRFKIQEGVLGGSGIYSTTNDLLIWINNFDNNVLISKESFTEMTTNALLKDGSKTEYGLGYDLGFWKDFSKTIGHGGRWPGYSTIFDYNPQNKKVVIILRNFNNPSHISKVNNILYDIRPLSFITLNKSETDKFIGGYKSKEGNIREIVGENEKIYVQMNPSVKFELRPISKNKFVIIGFQPEVQFEFIEENGKVLKYIFRQPETGTMKEADRQ